MIAPGTSVSIKNRQLKTTDSKEIQYLYSILHAITNDGAILSEILAALGGATGYNTVTAYSVSNSAKTFTAGTVHSIGFTVLSGTISVNWGTTTVSYPTGYYTVEATSVFTDAITFTAATGSDSVIIHAQEI